MDKYFGMNKVPVRQKNVVILQSGPKRKDKSRRAYVFFAVVCLCVALCFSIAVRKSDGVQTVIAALSTQKNEN
ncbi:MAG: hypothetical protein ACI4SC_06100 [Candidatus Neoclostridium sp.]